MAENAELNNPIIDMMLRQVVMDTTELFDAFVKDKPSYVIGLSETEFKQNVLPFIVGRAPIPNGKQSAFIGYLATRAGSETNPIPVYGVDGSVLFEIPPLLNTASVRSGDFKAKITLGNTAQEAKLRSGRLPIEGRALMNSILNAPSSPLKVVEEEAINETMETFFKMLEERYGEEGRRVDKTTSNREVLSTSGDDDDLLLD